MYKNHEVFFSIYLNPTQLLRTPYKRHKRVRIAGRVTWHRKIHIPLCVNFPNQQTNVNFVLFER